MLFRYITFYRKKVLYLTAACIFGGYISFHDACIPVVGKIGTNVTLNAVDVLSPHDQVRWSYGSGGQGHMLCIYTFTSTTTFNNTRFNFSCLKNYSLLLINVTTQYSTTYRTMTSLNDWRHKTHYHKPPGWNLDTCYNLTVNENGTFPTTTKKPSTTIRTTTATTTKKTTTTRTTTTTTTAKKTTSTTHHRHSNPKESTTPNSHVELHVGLEATAAETPLQPSPQYQHVATHALWVLAVIIVIIIIIIFYFRIPQKLWLLWQHDKHGIVLIPQTDL
ncbi:membrane glycoprotein UL11 [Human betaherpesvirus 5]|uniref:Membrane glycoprotein UL11 n=1 Tax=Human cytomegalovirus TaxID=10359 RepID=A0A0G2U3Q2_HCMV|nr:membrane glycoprotein UL11 [Human betaherpesvirus 5]